MSRGTAIPTKLHVRPAMTQISQRISAVWPESSKGSLCVTKDPKRLQADSEDSDKPSRVRNLNWVFAGRTCNLAGNAVTRLILFSIIKINIMLFVNSESHDQPAYLFSEIQSTLFLFCCSLLLMLLGCCFLFCFVLFCFFVFFAVVLSCFFFVFFTSCTVIGCNVSTNSEDSKQPCKDICSKAKSYLHCSYIF